MPLDTQNFPISFAQGIDTKTDPKQVVVGKLLTLENGVFTSANRLKKRHGYNALATTIEGSSSAIVSAVAAMTFKSELLQFTGTRLYSYSESTQRWNDKGQAVSCSLAVTPVIRNTYGQTSQDSALHPTGLYVFAWEDSRGGVRYSVTDSATGQSIVSDQQVNATGIDPRVMVVGAFVLILYLDTSGNRVVFKYVPVNTPATLSLEVEVSTNLNGTNKVYDAMSLGDRIFVTWNTSEIGNAIGVRYINAFLTVSSELDVATEQATTCIGIFGDTVNQTVWVSYFNGTKVRYFVASYGLSTSLVLSATDIETVGSIVRVTGVCISGSGRVFYEKSAGAAYNHLVRYATVTSGGSVGTPAVLLRSVGLGSKPFYYNSVIYLMVAYESVLQPTYFIVNQNGFIVLKLAPSNGGGLRTRDGLPQVSSTGDTSFSVSYLIKDLLTTVGGTVYTQTGVQNAMFDFNDENTYLRSELANNQHIAGGVLNMYDGANLVEHGFHLFPENVSCSTMTGAGSIAAGVYQYFVVYQWTDFQGQIHRSAPSVGVSQTTTTSSSTNTLTIPTLRLTAKTDARSPVLIVVYRTANAGTIPYQITSVTSPLYNDMTVDSVTYADTAADSSIIGNPILYTTGGVVDDIAAPAVSVISTYRNRVVVIPAENRTSYWFSKEVVPGAPVEFSDILVANINQNGGDITAIAALDDKLVLFKKSIIYYTAWQGPDATGSQSDISEPVLVPTDTGTINPRSIVLTPMGLMYQSLKGIYLLDRSLTVSYIGNEVESFNGQTITAAVLVANTNQVRFTTQSGTALVYDYFFRQWSTFTNHAAVDAVLFQNQFTYLNQYGVAMQENDSVFTDAGAFIPLRIVSAWMSLAGLSGFQRAKNMMLLGEYRSPHQLLVQVAYDFNPTFLQEDYIDATALLDTADYGGDPTYGDSDAYGGEFPKYEFRVNFARQKCEAIQIAIEDVQSTDVGEGFNISSMTLRAGVKKGLNKIPAARVS